MEYDEQTLTYSKFVGTGAKQVAYWSANSIAPRSKKSSFQLVLNLEERGRHGLHNGSPTSITLVPTNLRFK